MTGATYSDRPQLDGPTALPRPARPRPSSDGLGRRAPASPAARAVLGERPRDVLEQARTSPRVDGDLDAEGLRRAAVPADGREALRVAGERPDVGAVLAVDRDSLAERDVADDLVAGHRRAAPR